MFPKSDKFAVGSPCNMTSGQQGICTEFNKCTNLYARNLELAKRNTCGYVRKTPIWCCPTPSIQKNGKI